MCPGPASPASPHLLEAVVKGEVVSDRVLPARLAALVEGEVLGDVAVDGAEGEAFPRRRLDRHGDERRVRVRRTHQSETRREVGEGSL